MLAATSIFLIATQTLLAAQTAVPKASKSIDSIEDIEIGIPADLVIAGLTKQGYTLKDPFQGKRTSIDLALWNVLSKDKIIGEFSAEKGRITSAELLVYDSQNSAPGDGAIELAEALYWIFYDSGVALPSKNRDSRETGTGATLSTREIEQRTPGQAFRQIFVDLANGARYRITVFRAADKQSLVTVNKLAPFLKKK